MPTDPPQARCSDSVISRFAGIVIRCPGAIIGLFLFISLCSLIPMILIPFVPSIFRFDAGLGAFAVSHEPISNRMLAFEHLVGDYENPDAKYGDDRRRLSSQTFKEMRSKTEMLHTLSNMQRIARPQTHEHRALKQTSNTSERILPLINDQNEEFWRLMFHHQESISYCAKHSDCPDEFYCGSSQQCYPCIDPKSGLTCTFFADADCSLRCPSVTDCELFNLNWAVPRCDPKGLSQECGPDETCRLIPSTSKIVPQTYTSRCGQCSPFEPPLARLQPPLCPATCLGNLTCDQAIFMHAVRDSVSLSCEALETNHTCNCHGCLCDTGHNNCKAVSGNTNRRSSQPDEDASTSRKQTDPGQHSDPQDHTSNSVASPERCIDCSGRDCDGYMDRLGDGVCEDFMGSRSFSSASRPAPVNFRCKKFDNDRGDCETPPKTNLRSRTGIDGKDNYLDERYGSYTKLRILYVPKANWFGDRPRVNVLSSDSLKGILFLERTVMQTIEEICEQSGDGPDVCGMLVPHTCQDLLADMDRHGNDKNSYQLQTECDSLLPLVFPDYPYSDSNMISSAKISQLASTMAELKDVWLKKDVKKMFDRNFTQCDTASALLATTITYKMSYDHSTKEWFDDKLDTVLRQAALDPRAHGMEALYSYSGYRASIMDFIGRDVALVIAVIGTNFVLTWFHTESLGLASASVFGILMTFPLAYCVYRFILQVKWFGILNLVALFVVLGIGADDTFVLADSWKQSAAYFSRDDLQSRMEYTLRKSFRSMLTTSITSAAAFFANVISDIPPLRLFGILIGCMVIFDFLITMTFLPAVMVCVERCTPRDTWCFCFKRRPRVDPAPKKVPATTVELVTLEATASPKSAEPSETTTPAAREHNECTPDQSAPRDSASSSSSDVDVSVASQKADDSNMSSGERDTTQDIEAGVKDAAKARKDKGAAVVMNLTLVEKFFIGPYSTVCDHSLGGTVFVLIIAIVTAVCAYSAMFVQPQKEVPILAPDWHNYAKLKKLECDILPCSEYNMYPVGLTLVWGARPVNNAPSFIDPYSVSTLELDTGFDPSSVAAQEHMINICDKVINSQTVFRSLVHCWVYEFKEWLANEHPEVEFPVAPTANRTDPHSFDTLVRLFGKHVAGRYNRDNMLVWQYPIDRAGPVDYNNKLQGCTMQALQTIEYGASTGKLRQQYDVVQAMMDEFNEDAPAGVDKGFQITGRHIWVAMKTVESLQTTGLKAVALSGAVAVTCLLLSTLNLVITFFAIVVLCGILACVLALLVWFNMSLGVIESICLSILMGLAVDYTTHLANAYVETPETFSRRQRSSFMVGHMGISVLWGATTTIVGGVVLLFGHISFFPAFGRFLVSQSVLSIIFSLGFFTAMCFIIGPTQHQGDLKYYCERLRSCRKKRKRSRHANKASMQPTNALEQSYLLFNLLSDGSAATKSSNAESLPPTTKPSNLPTQHRDENDAHHDHDDDISAPIQSDESSSDDIEPAAKTKKQHDERAGSKACDTCNPTSCAAKMGAWSPTDPLDAYRQWTRIGSLLLVGLALLVALICIIVHVTAKEPELVCSGNRTWDVTMPFNHDEPLPPGETNYLCSGVEFPKDCTYYIQRVEPLDRGGHVAKYPSFSPTHHMILFASYKTFQQCPFTCYDMPDSTGMVTSWALGGGDELAPEGYGQAVGGLSSVINGALQVHYDNPFHAEGVRFTDGGSGFRLHMTADRPPKGQVASYMTGFQIYSKTLKIPPRSARYTIQTEAQVQLYAPVMAQTWALHMHQIGHSIKAEVLHRNRTMKYPFFGALDPYDFNLQTLQVFDQPMQLNPGDWIRITCTYDSSDRSGSTSGGFASSDEMCVGFFNLYPAKNMATSAELSYSGRVLSNPAPKPTGDAAALHARSAVPAKNQPIVPPLFTNVESRLHAVDWVYTNTPPPTLEVHKGDLVQFDWDGSHDVYLLPSQQAFADCDFTNAVKLGAVTGLRIHTGRLDCGDTYYFACRIGDHCQGGMMKLAMHVMT